MTAFEEVFDQFATTSTKTVGQPAEENLLTPRQSDLPLDNKRDVIAAQVRLFSFKFIIFVSDL